MLFKKRGVLGINARNLLYIGPYNKKKAIKLADDKIKTKQFLSAREIPVPRLFGIIRHQDEIEKFDFSALPKSFVIKPNHGYGGEGIIPIIKQKDDLYITAGGKELTKEDLKEHISDIVEGRFSISNVSDTAFFEQLIISDDSIGKYSYEGLPDIRVVVHNLIPVMAMLRLPTRESGGKANLHLGGVGVGIDIAKGETTFISYKNRIIEELPDGLGKIRGFQIPYWDEILLIASKVQLLTNLGYMAVDICIDKNSGPVLLEINARAGLGVQTANLAPLRKRLERIEGVKVTTPTKGVRIAKDMFGNVMDKEVKNITGKQIVSLEETVEIIQKEGTTKLNAKIDTGKTRTSIDEDMANQIGLLDNPEDYDDEKSTLKLKFALKGQRVQTVVDLEKINNPKYKIIIGNRDLANFLVDSSKSTNTPQAIKNIEESKSKQENKTKLSKDSKYAIKQNHYEIDQKLLEIDNKIKLLYHLRPLNLDQERDKFLKKPNFNPQFEYARLQFDPLELEDKLAKITPDDSPLGIIFQRKKKEISRKIALLEAVDQNNFTELSVKLFGKPSQQEVKDCLEIINTIDKTPQEKKEKTYTDEEVKEIFEKVFEKYGLKTWKAKIKENLVANCVAGKNNRMFIKKGINFTESNVESLIVHEIETHILTAVNGKQQPYDIFNRGLANYLITQEGMAMYNVEQQTDTPFSTNLKAHTHVVSIFKALTSSFLEIYNELLKIGIPEHIAFRSALKAKRGFMDTSKPGAFTKDYVYYKGYHQVREFIENGGALRDLYIGKMNIDDLKTVKQIENIKQPTVLPGWLK